MTDQLSTATLSELRAQLERQRDELNDQIRTREVAQGANELLDPIYLNGPDADLGDLSAHRTEWDYTCMVVMGLRQQLADVEHALVKFDDGTYGVCEDCKRPIPERRLRRIPEARYDVEHQAWHEDHERSSVQIRSLA